MQFVYIFYLYINRGNLGKTSGDIKGKDYVFTGITSSYEISFKPVCNGLDGDESEN